jgi:hypothetical protein
MLHHLPKRGTSFGVRRLAPEESGQLLSGMRTRFENKIGEKRECLGAELRRDGSACRASDSGWTEQSQSDIGHQKKSWRGDYKVTPKSRTGKRGFYAWFTVQDQGLSSLYGGTWAQQAEILAT